MMKWRGCSWLLEQLGIFALMIDRTGMFTIRWLNNIVRTLLSWLNKIVDNIVHPDQLYLVHADKHNVVLQAVIMLCVFTFDLFSQQLLDESLQNIMICQCRATIICHQCQWLRQITGSKTVTNHDILRYSSSIIDLLFTK